MQPPASRLVGLSLEGGWYVKTRMDGVSGATGGNFSCGYEIVHNTRGTAFLKALDYTAAFKLPDPPSALNSLTAAFLFERNVLGRCVARNMDRVVRSIGEGRVKVDDSPLGTVDYLIFEAAAGDLRTQMSAMKKVETAWKLRALHHMATGVNQLHAAQIAHQDLKPSNVLIFETQEAKVADLGCASLRGTLSPRDDRPFAGDPAYAPPELHYGYTDPEWTNRRLGCDAYLMGSMIVFMFTGSSLTALLSTELAPAHRWGAWKGTYADVLPYVRDAFDRAIEVFGRHIEGDELRKELQTMLRHLCEPDVSLRGHPLNRRGFAAKFSLERFVSKLDLLARRSEFTLR